MNFHSLLHVRISNPLRSYLIIKILNRKFNVFHKFIILIYSINVLDYPIWLTIQILSLLICLHSFSKSRLELEFIGILQLFLLPSPTLVSFSWIIFLIGLLRILDVWSLRNLFDLSIERKLPSIVRINERLRCWESFDLIISVSALDIA